MCLHYRYLDLCFIDMCLDYKFIYLCFIDIYMCLHYRFLDLCFIDMCLHYKFIYLCFKDINSATFSVLFSAIVSFWLPRKNWFWYKAVYQVQVKAVWILSTFPARGLSVRRLFFMELIRHMLENCNFASYSRDIILVTQSTAWQCFLWLSKNSFGRTAHWRLFAPDLL